MPLNLTYKEIVCLFIVGGLMGAFMLGVAMGTVQLSEFGSIVAIIISALGTIGTGAVMALKKGV